MSSWIPSLFNDDDDDHDDKPSSTPRSPSAGVKEDLSAVLRGVASFLKPPPPQPSSSSSSSSDPIAGIKNDLAEIQGSFKSGLSLISSKLLTSNFLQFQNDDIEEEEQEEEEDMVGINEEVVGFVRKISARSELWTDFPIPLPNDFDMSDYQREHATHIDQLVPELVTLRKKICNQISEEKFWLIYFVLLFPRLNDEDLELLSTPEVFEARETLINKLHNKTDVLQGTPENSTLSAANKEAGKGCSSGEALSEHNEDSTAETAEATKNRETLDKMKSLHHSEGVDDTCTSASARNQSENEEDVSFSDLEDDNDVLSKSNKVLQGRVPEGTETSGKKSDHSPSRCNRSEGEESNDWQTVDDTDFDNLAEI